MPKAKALHVLSGSVQVYSGWFKLLLVAAAGKAAGSREDRLQLLRSCLMLFEGVHAFHNFTKRRLYRDEHRDTLRRKRRRHVHTGELWFILVPGSLLCHLNHDVSTARVLPVLTWSLLELFLRSSKSCLVDCTSLCQ